AFPFPGARRRAARRQCPRRGDGAAAPDTDHRILIPSGGPCRAAALVDAGGGDDLMASVTFEHVTKAYDGTIAVRDLSLNVGDGEFLVRVGPSGCGKTTALRMIAGLEQITDGRLLIGDGVVNDLAPVARDLARVFRS